MLCKPSQAALDSKRSGQQCKTVLKIICFFRNEFGTPRGQILEGQTFPTKIGSNCRLKEFCWEKSCRSLEIGNLGDTLSKSGI